MWGPAQVTTPEKFLEDFELSYTVSSGNRVVYHYLAFLPQLPGHVLCNKKNTSADCAVLTFTMKR